MTCDDAEKNRLTGTPVTETMTARLVRAVIDALGDSSPFLMIGIGDREINLSWGKEPRPSIPEGNDDA